MRESPSTSGVRAAARARLRGGRGPALAVALALAVLFAFAPLVRNEFVNFDDDVNLTGNPSVQQGFSLRGVRWAFTTTESRNWHPLTWLSHMLDFRLFGLWAGGHHAVSALLHAANTALLFALLHAMTGALWPSALVAALFGLHPLRVESVAWASERKDVLSLLFGLLATGAYLRWIRRCGSGSYAAALLLFGCALMSKAMLVTLPGLLLLLDFWPLDRWSARGWPRPPRRRLLLEKAPFFALSAAVGFATYRIQQSGGAMGYLVQFPLTERLGNALTSCGAYLARTLWPAKLAVFYPYAWQDVPRWQPFASATLIASVTVFTILIVRRRPAYFVGWAWFLGTLVPVIGVIQVGSQSMADRYTYLPQIGVLLMVSWVLRDLAKARPRFRAAIVAALPLILFALIAATRFNVALWRTSETLFAHAVQVTRNNYIAMSNLGLALTQTGREVEGRALIAKALRLSPDFRALPYERGGDHYAAIGRPDDAAKMYRQALELVPYNKTIREKLRALGAGAAPTPPPPAGASP